MTTDEIISRCYEHGQPDYILAADRLKELRQAATKLANEVKGSFPLLGPSARRDLGNSNYTILFQSAHELLELCWAAVDSPANLKPDPKEFELLLAVEQAARDLPRAVPGCGGVSTAHTFQLEAGHVWANDLALKALDKHRRGSPSLPSHDREAPHG